MPLTEAQIHAIEHAQTERRSRVRKASVTLNVSKKKNKKQLIIHIVKP